MTKKVLRKIDISSSIDPLFLENTLTADISVLESFLDLIDNSIDAARDNLLESKTVVDKYGLPESYAGFKIHIRLGQKIISILDNCGGINEDSLKSRAFNIANSSNHKFGIGHYGVGLKRSLLKFGRSYFMSSDDGINAKKMRFSNQSIGQKPIVSDILETSGKKFTLFIVSDIKPEIFRDIERGEWYKTTLEMLSIRYAAYISKGLKISLSSAHLERFDRISGHIPSLRKNCKIKPVRDILELDGVRAHIEYGVHDKYYFSTEDNHSIQENSKLTKEFGLYFICNDRVIVVASTAREHGWAPAVWHSEYNGFVAIIRFVSEDSRKMPWNTLKTALRTESELFSETKKLLKEFTDKYRQDARKYFRKPRSSQPITSPADTQPTPSVAPAATGQPARNNVSSKTKQAATSAIKSPHLHIQNWDTLLPPKFPCATSEHILDAFIVEAARLEIRQAPNASLILLRSILEKALKKLITDSGYYPRVKDHYFEKVNADNLKKGKAPISEEHKQSKLPSLDMILPWLREKEVEIEIYGAKRSELSLATRNATRHLPKINGVVHGNEAVDEGQVKIIRNEIYSLLAFCAQTISSPK